MLYLAYVIIIPRRNIRNHISAVDPAIRLRNILIIEISKGFVAYFRRAKGVAGHRFAGDILLDVQGRQGRQSAPQAMANSDDFFVRSLLSAFKDGIPN